MRKKQKNVTEEQNTKSMRKAKKEGAAMKKKDGTTGGHKFELYMIFIATCIAVVAIALATTYSIYKIPESTSMESSEKYIADLLASGLAIVGIAISVWAGLNIANAIERKDVDLIDTKIKEAYSNIEEIHNDVDGVRNDKQNVNYNTFLQELLKTGNDEVSAHFYKSFSVIKKIEWEELIEMVLLEQNFSELYNNYGEKSKVKSSLVNKSNEGIKKAEKLLKCLDSIEDGNIRNLVQRYLQYRKTEFHFMNVYMVDKEKSYVEFELAAQGFEESQKLFGINLPNVGSNIENYVQKDNLELAIYFANSIGEACSKVTHREDIPKDDAPRPEKERFMEKMNPYSEKAIFYLELAVKLSEKLPQREVYYRNLGCAYERKDRNNFKFGNEAENIIKSYRKALKAVISYEEDKDRVEKVYKTLLSYYHVWLNNFFKFGDKESKVFSDLNSFESFMNNLKNKTLEKHTIEYLYNFNHISELSVLDNPRFSLNRSMYGFSLSWIIVLLLIHNKEIESKFGTNIEEYLKEIHKCVLTLELMQMSDDYYKDLKNRYEILSAYCKEHEII